MLTIAEQMQERFLKLDRKLTEFYIDLENKRIEFMKVECSNKIAIHFIDDSSLWINKDCSTSVFYKTEQIN